MAVEYNEHVIKKSIQSIVKPKSRKIENHKAQHVLWTFLCNFLQKKFELKFCCNIAKMTENEVEFQSLAW